MCGFFLLCVYVPQLWSRSLDIPSHRPVITENPQTDFNGISLHKSSHCFRLPVFVTSEQNSQFVEATLTVYEIPIVFYIYTWKMKEERKDLGLEI